MKRLVALFVLILLLIPNVAIAKPEDYGTIIWEGVLTNNNNQGEGIRVRYTLTGVVGIQVADGKVAIYDEIMTQSGWFRSKHYIINIVDGGTIKLEYLGEDNSKDYQTSEGILGTPTINTIEKLGDELRVSDRGYIKKSNFFNSDDYNHFISPENPEEFTDLKVSRLKGKKLLGLIYLPITQNDNDCTSIRVVSENEAQRLLKEIKDGHRTRVVGKFFEETKVQDDIFYRKFKSLTTKALEEKYGIKDIYVKKGHYPEGQLLVMLDKIYSRFPDGLIQEITSYYKAKGINTYIRFTEKKDALSGHFSDSGGKITINYYTSIYNDFGDWVIAHELGHYVHKYLNERYGYDKLKSEWTSINDGLSYDSKAFSESNISEKELNYFVRDYGKVSYSEDFATLFELIAGNDPIEFKMRVLQQPQLPLKSKVDVLNDVLVNATKSVTNTKNLWGRAIPQSASSFATKTCEDANELGLIPQGDRFSGLYTTNITREDFALLAVSLIEQQTGKSITDYAYEKGVGKEYYYNLSLSAIPAEDGSTQGRIRSNYAFCDISNYSIFDLHNLGVINGISEKIFDPEATISRQQAAAILRNIADVLGKNTTAKEVSFTDSNEIASWFKSGVNFVTSNNIMNGYNNKFNPKDKLSYEQAYIIMYNFATKMQ